MTAWESFTLQSLCLGVITKYFERFYSACNVTNDETLQKNLLFLQKKFSDDLAYKLSTYFEKYSDFFLHQYLTYIDLDWLSIDNLLAIDDVFCRLPNLQTLILAHGDEVLESVTKFCPKLSRIDGQYSHISDRGIEYLCDVKDGMLPCPELKIIDLAISSITYKGAEKLIQSLPSLEEFCYSGLPFVLHSLHKKKASSLQAVEFFNITELDLTLFQDGVESYYSAEIIKSCIILLPKIESLTCKISNESQLDALSNSRLKKLDLTFHEIFNREEGTSSVINIDNFLKSSGCNLRTLSLQCFSRWVCKVSASVLATHCPVLNNLTIDSVDFTEDNNGLPPTFPCLTRISWILWVNEPTKIIHLLFSSSPKLETVEIINSFELSNELMKEILTWSRSTNVTNVFFTNLNGIEFLKDFLFSCRSLKQMTVINRYYANYLIQPLRAFAETLLNKPKIFCY